MPEPNRTFTEEIQITGDKLIASIKDLLHEGNVRHIVVKNAEGHTLIEFPVTVGVVGLLIAPMLAAVAAIAVYAADFKLIVTRDTPASP
jgi:hypothetical protein